MFAFQLFEEGKRNKGMQRGGTEQDRFPEMLLWSCLYCKEA